MSMASSRSPVGASVAVPVCTVGWLAALRQNFIRTGLPMPFLQSRLLAFSQSEPNSNGHFCEKLRHGRSRRIELRAQLGGGSGKIGTGQGRDCDLWCGCRSSVCSCAGSRWCRAGQWSTISDAKQRIGVTAIRHLPPGQQLLRTAAPSSGCSFSISACGSATKCAYSLVMCATRGPAAHLQPISHRRSICSRIASAFAPDRSSAFRFNEHRSRSGPACAGRSTAACQKRRYGVSRAPSSEPR